MPQSRTSTHALQSNPCPPSLHPQPSRPTLPGAAAASKSEAVVDALSEPANYMWEQLDSAVPFLTARPKLTLVAAGAAAATAGVYYLK